MKSFVSTYGFIIRPMLVAIVLSALVAPGANHHAQNQGARTERSSMSYDKDGNLVGTETDFDAQNRPIEKREIKNGKVRKRTQFTYPKGFTKPNTSTTEYGPDGKTPVSIKNDDVDKDGNPTSSVTTTYDANGNEIGGSKRVRDSKTGKDTCYKWDPKKGVYEEVPCPQEVAESSEPSGNSQNARAETIGGLRTVTFGTPQGQIHLYLPDDMMAGDTISGTVFVEPRKPASPTDEVFVKQLYLDFLHREKPPGAENWISRVSVPEKTGTAQEPTKFVIDLNSNVLPIILKDADGKELGSFTFPIFVPQAATQAKPANNDLPGFQFPSLGQAGGPTVITGPFDGNSSNTMLKWCINLTPSCEQSPSTGGVIAPLAESPRKAVFQAPINVTGPIQIQLNEGKTETKAEFRNIRVDLSAPKTNLRKGESTTLKIEVNGLQGIKQPVPLTLDAQGVITMEGGEYQPLLIQPSQVGADGRYITTRGITGIQAGGWGANATVVVQPFNICLRDDNNPQTVILFNSFTGDYKFTEPVMLPPAVQTGGVPGQTGGTAKPNETKQSGGTAQVVAGPVVPGVPTILFPGPIFVGPATGTVTRNGCTITLDDNRPDRIVIATVDMCTHTGTASVETAPPKSPKIKFTITDRNTTDNTCTCGPGCK